MPGGGLSPTRLARLSRVMAGYVDRGEVPGLVWLLSRRGEVHVEAIGNAGRLSQSAGHGRSEARAGPPATVGPTRTGRMDAAARDVAADPSAGGGLDVQHRRRRAGRADCPGGWAIVRRVPPRAHLRTA